ncbi:copper amine oxidase N-terminal domain-containing protein [Tissierella sp.]|uniref:copper amine oxidase N-terminal domain-containing protein n=1 Tax=Tissierella sp. TaxID=41274 RepID=UPI002857B8CB|nr:copper amine oxidase N-terminal domain-containing protein [Tissierella sp.]MDR7856861.1 copper amine oxidase N-terminal domain-containing protein [Tissierella sp.]
MIKRHNILKIISIAFILISLTTTPAHAWKVKTHVYSANLILDEIRKNNGYVEIKPYGKFRVDPDLEPLLRLYPDFYRAGSLGPDLQPDIIIGQTIFHPGVGLSTSGEFIEDLWWSANNIKDRELTENEKILYNSMQSIVHEPIVNPNDKNDPASKYLEAHNRGQARAYVLGLMAHAAGDYFGHSYINNWAGGSWPNMADGLSSAEKDIIKRHSVIENYIDSRIPSKYKSKDYNKINSPQRFLFDNTLVGGNYNLENVLDDDRRPEFVLDYVETPHLDLFFDIRDACKRRIDKINRNRNGDLWDMAVWLVSAQYAQKSYCEAWIEDIDRGLGDWIAANERAAQKMLLDGNGMEQYKEELKKWADKHLLSMLGFPDVAVSVINGLGVATDFVMEIVPDSIEAAYKEAKEDILNFMIRKSFNVDLKEWMTLLDPPLSVLQTGNLFPAGSFERLNAEMGNFNTNTNTTEQEFAAFKNTLTFMKLMLIGDEGIQELRKAAGCKGPVNDEWEWFTLTQFIKNMDYGYKWGEEEPLEGFYLSESLEDKEKVVNVIFDLESNIRKKSFSDMTKGPVEIIADKGIYPDISVKYYDAPVGGRIGLYSIDSLKIDDVMEYITIDKNNTSGTFKTFVEECKGKFHFRMYNRDNILIAASDTIEVINKDREIKFTHTPSSPLKAGEYFSFILFNGDYKKGYYGVYSENEDDPGKFVGKKEEISFLEAEYELYAPENSGRYKLRAYDNNNVLLAESSTFNVIKEEAPSVKPPTEKTDDRHMEVFDKGVIMSWPSGKGLGYRLFRSTRENDLGISVTDFYITSNSYADINIEANTTYYYTVMPVLSEANPMKGMEETLGNVIETYIVKTGNDILKSDNKDNFIVIQIDNKDMSINGISKEIDEGRDTTPVVISSRTMVPIRGIVEAMGGTVSWDNINQQITLIANGNTVNMWVGKTEITVNGVRRQMDVPLIVQNGRTYVPIRFAAENLNAEVEWINSTKSAVITY